MKAFLQFFRIRACYICFLFHRGKEQLILMLKRILCAVSMPETLVLAQDGVQSYRLGVRYFGKKPVTYEKLAAALSR